jgi:hypothetical protein
LFLKYGPHQPVERQTEFFFRFSAVIKTRFQDEVYGFADSRPRDSRYTAARIRRNA